MAQNWRVAVGAMLAGLASTAASAEPLDRHFNGTGNACYERIYDPAHLAKHPRQSVTFMRIEHFPTAWGILNDKGETTFDPENWSIHYRVSLKRRATGDQLYEATGTCRPDGDRLDCYVECDGGGFTLSDDAPDKIMLKPHPDGFAIFACGEGEETGDLEPVTDDDSFGRLTPGADDKAFRLIRTDQTSCDAAANEAAKALKDMEGNASPL